MTNDDKTNQINPTDDNESAEQETARIATSIYTQVARMNPEKDVAISAGTLAVLSAGYLALYCMIDRENLEYDESDEGDSDKLNDSPLPHITNIKLH